MNGKVTVTRGELSRVRALIVQAVEELDVLIDRQDTREVQTDEGGWPLLGEGSGVIPLPDTPDDN